MKKNVDVQKVKEIFSVTKDLGITTLAYFMIGSPTETKEQIRKTIDFAIELDPNYAHISITTPFPATELYKMGLERKIFSRDFWREFASHPSPEFVPAVWEESLSSTELNQMLRFAYRRFYFRSNYIFKKLWEIRSWPELQRKVKAGTKLFYFLFRG